MFVSYEPCPTERRVQTADGTLLVVARTGRVNVAPIALLTHVLHVPMFFVSLVSVQRLLEFNKYKIIFDSIDAFLCNKVCQRKIEVEIKRAPLSSGREIKFKVAAVASTSHDEESHTLT